MITDNRHIVSYLQDYHNGNISQGKGIDIIKLDERLKFKQGQLTIINGLDNVGKTIWMLWYYLCLSYKHDLKWCIYSGENKAGQLVRQLIQFMTGKRLNDLGFDEVLRYEIMIGKWFTFISNDKFYKSGDLFKIFADGDYDGCLVDPFTGMDREYTHAANYDFLNESRQFCNVTGKSLYVNTHVTSEAARRTFPETHALSGYPFPPSKSQSEGGQPFGNRTDDFITIHRLVGHPSMQYKTLLYVRKIKDTETGGCVTAIDDPLEFDFNGGLGFTVDGENPLNASIKDDLKLNPLSVNTNFEDEAPF